MRGRAFAQSGVKKSGARSVVVKIRLLVTPSCSVPETTLSGSSRLRGDQNVGCL